MVNLDGLVTESFETSAKPLSFFFLGAVSSEPHILVVLGVIKYTDSASHFFSFSMYTFLCL